MWVHVGEHDTTCHNPLLHVCVAYHCLITTFITDPSEIFILNPIYPL